MRTLIFSIFAALALIVSACCADPDSLKEQSVLVDTLQEETSIIDTLLTDSGQYVDEIAETEALIEATYGEQWEFCDCVIKNDSVNKAVETSVSDADFDRVMARMDVIEQHCKSMLAQPNTTPEEREKHERKVRKCLQNQ